MSSRLERLDQLLQKHGISSTVSSQLRNLAAYYAPIPPDHYPIEKQSAVLALLHIPPSTNSLLITLTTRSAHLRAHPGETCLPGGKRDDGDESIESTALREAQEEIALPLEEVELFHLTNLSAYAAGKLVVIPVVYWLVSPVVNGVNLIENLQPKPGEVEHIFHLPLHSFLALPSTEVDAKEEVKHKHRDLRLLDDRLYRAHYFSHSEAPTPVWGTTADILISLALVARYGLSAEEEEAERGEGKTGFGERWAEGQFNWKELVQRALDEE